MSVNNPLLNELSSIVKVRRFSEAIKNNKNASLVLPGPVPRGYFIAAISLTNKLVVVSEDAFGLYHESLGVKPLLFDYIPADEGDDIAPKVFSNNPNNEINSRLLSKPNANTSVIYTEHDLETHVALPELSNDGGFNSVGLGENIAIKDLINTLNKRGYVENKEAKFYGEYAHRGGIIDVFPPNTNNPARIELYGDYITSIRMYNPTSQLSLDQIDQIYIPELNPALSKDNTITYKNMYLNNGYIILYVNTDNKSCVIRNYDQRKNNTKTYTLKTRRLNIKEDMGKTDSCITTLFVVGGDKKERTVLHKNTVYI
ncbi:uncharacterized protein METZ01_LOCUS351685, partial [marine metagenome]